MWFGLWSETCKCISDFITPSLEWIHSAKGWAILSESWVVGDNPSRCAHAPRCYIWDVWVQERIVDCFVNTACRLEWYPCLHPYCTKEFIEILVQEAHRPFWDWRLVLGTWDACWNMALTLSAACIVCLLHLVGAWYMVSRTIRAPSSKDPSKRSLFIVLYGFVESFISYGWCWWHVQLVLIRL